MLARVYNTHTSHNFSQNKHNSLTVVSTLSLESADVDLNVWKEPAENSLNIQRAGADIRAVTLNKLIELLVPLDRPPSTRGFLLVCVYLFGPFFN